MKYYAVSDVHGFYTEMIKALADKGFFTDKENHKLIVCGDMMDRGEEAVKMQEFMLDLASRGELIFVRGNHEDLMLMMLNEIEKSYSEGVPDIKQRHIHNGTFDTARQLGGYSSNGADLRDIPDLLSKVRSSPFCSKLIPQSVNYFETKNYIFVHGWIPCKKGFGVEIPYEFDPNWRNASAEVWMSARWDNGMELAEEWSIIEPGKTIVCGHWHASYGHSVYAGRCSEFLSDAIFEPYSSEGIIAIDACTSHSGFVNCIVIEEE